MPISNKDFKMGLFPAQEGQTSSKIKVYKFLQKNKDKAYTAKEILSSISKLNLKQIRSSLTVLKQKDLVLQKHYYWMFNQKTEMSE